MVVTLLETPPKTVLAHLSGNPKSYFSSAMKHLSRQRARDLDELRTVVDASEGPYR